VHLGALTSSYSTSPFFLYYFETFEKVIQTGYEYILDLNMKLLEATLKILIIDTGISYTTGFKPVKAADNDLRYKISPKINSGYSPKKYLQVFNSPEGFVPRLSIIDLIFNAGPETRNYL
jgi:hypothetical protein